MLKIHSIRDIYPYLTSEDYKNRFIGEYLELGYRLHKLEVIIDKAKDNLLDFPLSCPITLLMTQAENMTAYQRVLEVRAEVENVTFPEVSYE